MTRKCVCHGWLITKFVLIPRVAYGSRSIHTPITSFVNRFLPNVQFYGPSRRPNVRLSSSITELTKVALRHGLLGIKCTHNFSVLPQGNFRITQGHKTINKKIIGRRIQGISTKKYSAIITHPGSRVSSWLASYEQLIGVKDVKESQEKVTQMEKNFLDNRQLLKNSRQELEGIQADLQVIRTRLDRTSRDDPKFLEHATEEHRMIQREKKVKVDYHCLLDIERETFDQMSASVRESHVKQKAQEEKTKYWSIIGSVVGTVLGIIGSTFISQRRTRDLKGMVNDLKEQMQYLDGGGAVEAVEYKIDNDLAEKILAKTGDQLKSQEAVIQQLFVKHEKSIHDQMKHIGRAMLLGGTGDNGHVTDLETIIENNQQKLEWEVKMSTLATVVFVYGAFAITVPILYNIFK